MASKGRPYRTVQVEDFEILIGKGAKENDELTLKVGAPGDVWLHAGGGTPGSHVIIRNPEGRDVPHAVLQAAAELAAWYSKAKNAARVKVDYCLVRDVSKPRGAPAGQVQIKRYKSITVLPAAPETAET